MKKKSLIMMLSAAVVVSSVAMGTIAYLTDRTSMANTFSVGQVDINVDEAQTNAEGQPVDDAGNVVAQPDAPRVDGESNNGEYANNYHLIPGQTYTKDPTMTVVKNSEECFVRMLVVVHDAEHFNAICTALKEKDAVKYANGDLRDLLGGYDAQKWNLVKKSDVDTNGAQTYEFRYFETVKRDADNDQKLAPLFETFTIPGLVTGTQLATLDEFKLVVEGHAIQKATFDDADAAWTAYGEQYPATGNGGTGSGNGNG